MSGGAFQRQFLSSGSESGPSAQRAAAGREGWTLESRDPDDVGLGGVDGTGRTFSFWSDGKADDCRGEVQLLAVQRERLLEFGVQTGATGTGGQTGEDSGVSIWI